MNYKTLILTAALTAGAILPSSALTRSYSVDDLTSGTWLPSESLYKSLATPMTGSWYGYYYGLVDPDLLYEINTQSLSFQKQSANEILVKGMFGGLLDLPFTLSGNKLVLKTNATAGGDPVYVTNYPAARPDIKKIILSPVKKYQPDDYNFSHTYISTGWTSDALDEVSGSQNEQGLYDLCISFNEKPVELQITYTNGSTEKIYVDTYQFDLFKPNSSMSDVEVKNGVSTPRSYRGEFEYLPGSTFQLANWGGRYAGLSPALESALMGYGNNNEPVYADYYYSDVQYMEGSYDLDAGTAILHTAPYTLELSSTGSLTNANTNKTVKLFKVMEQKSNGSWSANVPGTVTPVADGTVHKGTTRWMTNGGDCTTWARLEFAFNDWASVFSSSTADAKVGLIKDTRIIPDKEVEITIHIDVLDDIYLRHENSADHFLTATVPFVITGNEYFTTSYDVFVVQGALNHHSSVDFSKATKIGSVPYSAAAKGEYSVTGTFVPEINVAPGELFSDNFTFFVRANYGSEPHARNAGLRAAPNLEPTHHDLTPMNFNVTVGVDGLGADMAFDIKSIDGGIMVSAPSDCAVEIFDMKGAVVATGHANTLIPCDATGVLLVKTCGKTFKIVK